jgi:hypothetical protein
MSLHFSSEIMDDVVDKIQMKMKFESLPNEIVIECFEYLNGPDIIYAFEKLNYRFQMLIECIPLRIDFQMINKTIFDRFCKQILQNPLLKQQIYSIKLSDSLYTCKQIQTFLSFFSLKEFSQLQSLVLININFDNIEKIESMLPSLENLHRFSFDCWYRKDNLPMIIPLPKIQILSIPYLDSNLSIDKIQFITYLKVSDSCTLARLCTFLKFALMLKYLNINELSQNNDQLLITDIQANCLTSLIVKKIRQPTFSFLEILLRQTPNLENLILSTEDSEEILDSLHWKHLISSLLKHLKIFKFKFFIEFRKFNNIISTIEEIFDQFQNDFWHKEHPWHTVLILDDDYAIISTIPFYSNEFILKQNTNIYSNNNFDLFRKMKNLKLCNEWMKNISHYYFSNIKSLILSYHIFDIQQIESIKININLFNLNFLGIEENCRIESSSIILQILKQTPNLSSITIPRDILILSFNNNELCKYFNKMIKKLNISRNCNNENVHGMIYYNELPQFCQIFSNLEQLRCCIANWNDLIIILNQLPKLSHLKTIFLLNRTNDIHPFLQQIRSNLNKNFLYEYLDSSPCRLYLWNGEKYEH